MGSTSDWDVMSDAAATLAQFGVEFEKRVVSAHRTAAMTNSVVAALFWLI